MIQQNKSPKGMTLLEAIVALGIFAFMFVFIAQFVRQSHRQARKIKKDLQLSGSLSSVLDLMRRDFQSVSYLLDINQNFRFYFPLRVNEWIDEEGNVFDEKKANLEIKGEKTKLLAFLSPYFIFEGEGEEVKFVSYTFSPSDESSAQWLKIRYFVKDCRSKKVPASSSCLIRSSHKYWAVGKEEKGGENLVLLRDFDSLEFFYAEAKSFLNRDWKDQWKPREITSSVNNVFGHPFQLSHPGELPFPSAVKMEINRGDQKQSFFFPVSQSYLKEWNIYEREYPGFSKWEPPKKKKKESVKKEQSPAQPLNFQPKKPANKPGGL